MLSTFTLDSLKALNLFCISSQQLPFTSDAVDQSANGSITNDEQLQEHMETACEEHDQETSVKFDHEAGNNAHENLGVTPNVVGAGDILSKPADAITIKEINDLAAEMFEFVANDQDAACQEISWESARKYLEEKKDKLYTKKSGHLESITIGQPVPETNCICPIPSVSFKRTDQRVSYQTLDMKVNSGSCEILFNWKESKSCVNKHKLKVSYDDIFGINFDKVNKKLVLDVKDITTEKFIGSMSQDRSNKVSEYSSKVRFLPDVKLSQKIQITCQFHSSKDSQLVFDAIHSSSILLKAVNRGILDNYCDINLSNVSLDNLSNYYPVITDPVLVRSSQLCAKQIFEQALYETVDGKRTLRQEINEETLKDVVKKTASLQVKFEQLMKSRNTQES